MWSLWAGRTGCTYGALRSGRSLWTLCPLRASLALGAGRALRTRDTLRPLRTGHRGVSARGALNALRASRTLWTRRTGRPLRTLWANNADIDNHRVRGRTNDSGTPNRRANPRRVRHAHGYAFLAAVRRCTGCSGTGARSVSGTATNRLSRPLNA